MSFQGAKFGRVCQLLVETAPDSAGNAQYLTIPPAGQVGDGITIEFAINRQSFLGSQTAQFRIYGLGPVTRDAIYKDQFDWTQYRAIQFRAGYQTFMPQIFNGTVISAYSEKTGEETVTIIDAYDGAGQMTNSFTSEAANAGGPNGKTGTEVITNLASSMNNIQGPPVVGSFPVTNMRGEVLFGNTWGLIRQKSGGQATISDGIVYALNLNEGVLNGAITDISTLDDTSQVPIINSNTGLLDAPRRSGIMVEWDMIFEPRLTLFQVVSIQSTFNPQFNGIYKVMGLTHRGVISKAVAGDAVTTAKFLFGKGTSFAAAAQQELGT